MKSDDNDPIMRFYWDYIDAQTSDGNPVFAAQEYCLNETRDPHAAGLRAALESVLLSGGDYNEMAKRLSRASPGADILLSTTLSQANPAGAQSYKEDAEWDFRWVFALALDHIINSQTAYDDGHPSDLASSFRPQKTP